MICHRFPLAGFFLGSHVNPEGVPAKRQLTSTGLHGVASQKAELFKSSRFWQRNSPYPGGRPGTTACSVICPLIILAPCLPVPTAQGSVEVACQMKSVVNISQRPILSVEVKLHTFLSQIRILNKLCKR